MLMARNEACAEGGPPRDEPDAMNATLPADAPANLVDGLRAVAAKHGQRPALIQGAQRVSYATLWSDIVRLANAFVALGIAPGERIALLLDNSPTYVTAWYAALKAGAVVVPLNTAQRGRELARCVAHCEARLLVATAGHPDLAGLAGANPGLRHVLLAPEARPGAAVPAGAQAWHSLLATAATSDTGPAVTADQPAAILYTSGTTGAPRGVTLSHRNLVTNARAILAYLPLDEHDIGGCVLPFYYAYGNSVLHTHLAAGAALVLENSLTYPQLVLEALARERISGFFGVPSTFAVLLQRVDFAAWDLTALRHVTQAGGAMPPALASRLAAALPGAELYLMYGQTEATARITWLPPARRADKPGSVGIPVAGLELQIRDEHDRPVPPGTPGEVCVRGDSVMLGYWHDATATARVLRDGWLHTGDVGTLDAEGFLTLTGRRSDFIKTGAHRVSPVEIEQVIGELPGVVECAVAGIADETLGETIKAFVVVAPGATLDERRVQAHCRAELAAYKIPKEVAFVSELPKTGSGKVRRFLLGTERAP